MSNRYAGTCYRCGQVVPPGAGVFERVGRSQVRKWQPYLAGQHHHAGHPLPKSWLVQHHSCAAKYKGTTVHYIYNPAEEETPGDEQA